MSTYGRNFELRTPPVGRERQGRFYVPSTADGGVSMPIGVPVVHTGDDASELHTGALPVELATGAQAPQPGLSGIVLFEHAPNAFAGHDPVLDTYSDIDMVPVDQLCQVLNGDQIKVVLKNTEDRTFLHSRDYEGRIMVAGLAGATPTVEVGEYLTPGVGNDTDGYWAVTASADNAWMVVVNVENDRASLEARLLF